MNFLQYLWHAYQIGRRSRRMWANRTAYTWARDRDYRDFTCAFYRENRR